MTRDHEIRPLSQLEVSQVAGGSMMNLVINAAEKYFGECLKMLGRDGNYLYCGSGYANGRGGIVPR